MEYFKIVPDILVLAKSLGGGMPLGAFISRPTIMKTLSTNPPLSHVTTFGGHPVSCAAGLASLNLVLAKNLVTRAKKIGEILLTSLTELAHQYTVIREARGLGLMIGLEFKEAELCRRFVQRARKQGLLLGWTLHTNRVVRIAPPFTLSNKELKEALTIMKQALESLSDS